MNGKLKEYLQSIDDCIQIDDKIVTYKWVSKTLKVHTNTAKQLLYAYTKKPTTKDELLVTYIVAGEPRDGEGLVFRLVNARDLEETKDKFHKVTSVHVYSIQRGTAVSGADIYNAEVSFKLTADEQTCRSIQPGEKIERRDIKVVAIPDTVPSTSKKDAPAQSIKAPPKEKPKPKDPSPKKEETKEDTNRRTSPRKASPKKVDVKKPVPVKSGSINAMFKKQTEKKKVIVSSKTTKEEPMIVEVEEAELAPKDSNKSFQKEEQQVKTPVAKSQSKKRRKKSVVSEESTAKRRKRIKDISDSDSSNEESEEERRLIPELEMETPATIESEDEVIPSTPVEKGRRRVRKQIDRTFEDDAGFIYTKKEYVWESESDDEASEPPKKTPDKPPKAETSKEKPTKGSDETQSVPPKGNKAKSDPVKAKPGKASAKTKNNGTNQKQQSLLNFFSKK